MSSASSTGAAGSPRAAAVAQGPAPTGYVDEGTGYGGAGQPAPGHSMTWTGGGEGFFSRNLGEVIGGGTTAVIGAALTGFIASGSAPGLAGRPLLVGGLATLAAATGVALLIHAIRGAADADVHLPDASHPARLPSTAGITADAPIATGNLGHAHGTWTTTSTSTSNGHTTTSTTWHHVDIDMRPVGAIGDPRGYGSELDAARATPADSAAVIVRRGDRYFPMVIARQDHWSKVDDVATRDGAVYGMVGEDGRHWLNPHDGDETLNRTHDLDRHRDEALFGDDVGSFRYHRHVDRGIHALGEVDPEHHPGTLDDALRLAAKTPGDQAVVRTGSGIHVVQLDIPPAERTWHLDGLTVESGHGATPLALELGGSTYAPVDGVWTVASRAPA